MINIVECKKGARDTTVRRKGVDGNIITLFWVNDLSRIMVGDFKNQYSFHYSSMQTAVKKFRKLLSGEYVNDSRA